jgi:hypothetical protein
MFPMPAAVTPADPENPHSSFALLTGHQCLSIPRVAAKGDSLRVNRVRFGDRPPKNIVFLGQDRDTLVLSRVWIVELWMWGALPWIFSGFF